MHEYPHYNINKSSLTPPFLSLSVMIFFANNITQNQNETRPYIILQKANTTTRSIFMWYMWRVEDTDITTLEEYS